MQRIICCVIATWTSKCEVCYNAQSKIRKATYPWLYKCIKYNPIARNTDLPMNTWVLPLNTEIIQYIQRFFKTMYNWPQSDFKEYFMRYDELHKCLLILDQDTDTITLDGFQGMHWYLIWCRAHEHIKTTGNPVYFFPSSTLHASTSHLCQECYLAQCNQQQKLIWQEINLDNQVQADSHCPISKLSPCWLKMCYDNLRAATIILKCNSTIFCEKLQVLSSKDNEEDCRAWRPEWLWSHSESFNIFQQVFREFRELRRCIWDNFDCSHEEHVCIP